jgi:aspartate/methionine/tyrosine aminotransferase
MGLRNGETVLARNRQIIGRNRALLDAFFADFPGYFAWHRPQAGPVAFPSFTGGYPVERFCSELLEKEGVLLLPSSQFSMEGDFFRVGFGRSTAPDALKRLRKFMESRF